MATYKVLYVDGREHEVVAQRMSADHDRMRFEVRRNGSWQKLTEVSNRDVEVVRQRIIEANGMFRWVTARPATRVSTEVR